MIPVPIAWWTQYTATANGRILKLVLCENCATEYVYVLEREAEGSGGGFYLLDDDGAQKEAVTGAEEALRSYLENDFDPVPCPVCGHYQKYMFPKLYEGAAWVQTARLMAIVAGCVAFVGGMYWSVAYFQRPGDNALVRLVAVWALLAILGLIVRALGAVERSRAHRFDPNTEDQQARIAKARSRAITRADFEALQRKRGGGAADHGPGADAGAAPASPA